MDTGFIKALVCQNCGGPMTIDKMVCPHCGTGYAIDFANMKTIADQSAIEGRNPTLDKILFAALQRAQAEIGGVEWLIEVHGDYSYFSVTIRDRVSDRLVHGGNILQKSTDLYYISFHEEDGDYFGVIHLRWAVELGTGVPIYTVNSCDKYGGTIDDTVVKFKGNNELFNSTIIKDWAKKVIGMSLETEKREKSSKVETVVSKSLIRSIFG